MENKSFKVTNVKALDDDAPGTFEAIFAVFNNIDSYGDKVYPGALAASLQRSLPPVVWTHQWGTVPIGVTLEAYETDEGAYGKGQLFVEDHETARQVYAAMKNVGGDGQPALREFSFAYDIINGGWETEDGEEHYALRELDVIEWGPCLRGVNDSTRLVGVKGDEPNNGRVRPPKPSEGEKAEQGNPEPNSDPDESRSDEEAKARTRLVDLLLTK